MGAFFESAVGSTIYDVDGCAYIDFLAGAGSLNYGHNDPDLKAAVIEYVARDGIAHGLDLFTGAKGAFLESFERRVLVPRDLDHRVQFTGPTGANAVEAASDGLDALHGRVGAVAEIPVFTNAFRRKGAVLSAS